MATDAQWYYAQAGNQTGPVSTQELTNLIARGQVGPGDLVWQQGMAKWIPAGEVANLATTPVPSSVGPAAPIAMGYYTSEMGIPPRAVENLRGYARPLGDTGDWPLDDVRIRQFEETVTLRKKIAGAARLYRSLLFLSAISLAVFVPLALFAMVSPRGVRPMNGMVSLPATGLMLAFSLLYFFAHRATLKSHRWAPITMFIIFIVSGAYQIASIALFAALPGPRVGGPPVYIFQSIGGTVVLLFAGAFALASWRAISAIPKYLAQPAWCQELIVKAGL